MDIHSYDPSRDFSYTLGLSYIHPFRRKSFSFQGEILFLKHEYTYPETSWQESFSINTTTLRVPLLIRYSLPWIAQRPFFTVGAVLSRHLLLEKTSFPTTNTEISESIDLGAIQTKEAGFIAGAGVEFDVSLKQSVFIQCRYSYLHAIPIHNRGSNAVISMSAGINF